ncbi:MAG: serpin family protein [Desulfobacterales bacterium]|jgi:serpin B
MKRFIKWLVLLVVVNFLSHQIVSADENDMVKNMVTGNTSFALDLYKQLKSNEGNLFFSPFSISTALGMTYVGARQNTAKQMAAVLHFSGKQDQIHDSLGDLIAQINDIQKQVDLELRVANALWVQKDYQFLKEFLYVIQNVYKAQLNHVDFAAAHDAARRAINGWVEQQTNQRIKDLIRPGVLDALTRMVLVNAIYFKGFWDSQFKEKDTQELDFWVTPQSSLKASMMHQEQEFNYFENEQLQVLEMPYQNKALAMIVLLPKKRDSLADFENTLNLESVLSWQNQLRKHKVRVFFPRFKIESQFSLNQNLIAMGASDAFNPNRADFSGMVGRKDLFLSAVIHKAFVEVNEEGTEAAAATGAVVSVTSIKPPSPIFKADHPFIFFIRDNESQSILFLGRILNPQS